MVNYNPKVWVELIFHSYSKQVLKTLLPALIFMGLFTATCCYLELTFLKSLPAFTTVHSLLGIVLGLFLVFRTNSAYERWWEGRKLWGSLVNSSRNFAMKLNAVLGQGMEEDRKWFAEMISHFMWATKEHLRKGVVPDDMEINNKIFLGQLKQAAHKPNRIATAMYLKIEELFRKNVITGFHLTNFDKEMKDFVDLMGSCERIKKTPIPYSYTMYIKKFIFIYIITLPFGFIPTLGYYTIAVVLLVAFVLLSVELIAEEIEDPFGQDINDLPTDELTAAIKANVKEILNVD
ncbi:MAG: hypothetical protein OJF59_003277 [Cytophagales bacterium]|jgi:putative membrane protein|nr:hypothetical protein [Bacteroidota bacterium]MBS1982191.1 hypothetical protein [Bacteroidota bacterium]WHZ09521.1 MAG: hypothetical protein OJF59_003277 [Cytophagales bacterium]